MTPILTRLWRALRAVLAFYLIAIILVFLLATTALWAGFSPRAAFFAAFAGWPLSALALWVVQRYRPRPTTVTSAAEI